MTKLCVFRTYAETYNPPQPAEFCEDEAVPFSDYCGFHLFADKDAMFDDDPDPTDIGGW